MYLTWNNYKRIASKLLIPRNQCQHNANAQYLKNIHLYSNSLFHLLFSIVFSAIHFSLNLKSCYSYLNWKLPSWLKVCSELYMLLLCWSTQYTIAWTGKFFNRGALLCNKSFWSYFSLLLTLVYGNVHSNIILRREFENFVQNLLIYSQKVL